MQPIEVLFFASLVDRTGCRSTQITLPDDARVEDLWKELVRAHPRLRDLPFRPLVACDLEYADWQHRLKGVGEVAFLPPVSGG